MKIIKFKDILQFTRDGHWQCDRTESEPGACVIYVR